MPSKSEKQQRFFRLVKAVQNGDVKKKDVSKQVVSAAKKMTKTQVSHFADHLSKKRKRKTNESLKYIKDIESFFEGMNTKTDTKTIKLNVNAYWFNLLDRGKINFDYREVKPHWTSRFTTCNPNETNIDVLNGHLKQYDTAEFLIPYTNRKIRFAINSITVYSGKDIGIDDYKSCFVIELGDRLP